MKSLQAGILQVRFEKQDPEHAPFGQSLQLILQTILRDQSAACVCLYTYVEPDTLLLRDYAGTAQGRSQTASVQLSAEASAWIAGLRAPEHITEARTDWRVSAFPEVLLHSLHTLDVVPLATGDTLCAILTSGSTGRGAAERDDDARFGLNRLSQCAADLIERGSRASTAIDLISRIARLEADLADSKIAERALGLLSQSEWPGDAASVLQEHVERVLKAPDKTNELRQQLAELESTVTDRNLLSAAKRHMQTTLGITEEQAYVFLRNASRRTRQPLREIAQNLVEGRTHAHQVGA